MAEEEKKEDLIKKGAQEAKEEWKKIKSDPKGFFKNWAENWKKVILDPKSFFKEMDRSGGYKDPLIFALVVFLIPGIIFMFFTLGLSLIMWPLFGIIALFIGAAILFFVCTKLVGGKSNYEGTFRVVAYTSAVNAVSWIPLVGWIVGLYGIYVMVVGIQEVHQITTQKAIVAVVIVAVAMIILGTIMGSVGLLGSFVPMLQR